MSIHECKCFASYVSQKKRVYVIDDEQVVARTLCWILEKSGYEASMFSDAKSALEQIQKVQPDLVLSDLLITGEMNGIDLAELLAAQYPGIKVMLLNGDPRSSGPLNRAQDRRFFPNIYMKPIAPPVLLNKIAALLAVPPSLPLSVPLRGNWYGRSVAHREPVNFLQAA